LRYTESIEDSNRERAFDVLGQMEIQYEKRNPQFFNNVLEEESALVIRVHAVTVLSEIGDASSVPVLGDAMKSDPSPLIRHECAFSLGQMGLKSAVPYLVDATLNDPSEIVRHEAAAALGSIGDDGAREALAKASHDSSDEVRGSALASLFNLDYLRYSSAKKEHAKALGTAIGSHSVPKERRMPHP
jgi:HEAT repeat protein